MTDIAIDAEAVEEVTQNLPAVRAGDAVVARGELSVVEVVAQKDKIVQIMQAVMRSGVHYGRIPGIDKPSLFKPGAEAINVALRLAPHYTSEKIWQDDGHLTVSAACVLRHIPTDLVIATGEGLCSTRESKYAYRNQKRTCPSCGAEAIIKGKAEFGGGWICWKKEGGCGAKYDEFNSSIIDQKEGKVPNPDLADSWNTVLKMADKRALVAAVLNGTAASDVFTQDLEDLGAATPAEEMPRSGDRTSPAQGPRDGEKSTASNEAQAVTGGASTTDDDAPGVAFASGKQVTLLWTRVRGRGVDVEVFRRILLDITGQGSSKAIPARLFEKVLEAVEAAPVESPFKPPPGAVPE